MLFQRGIELWTVHPETRSRQFVLRASFVDFPGVLAFSPACDRLAFVAPGATVNAWEIHIATADGKRRQLTQVSPDKVENFRWSPDGRRIVYVVGTGETMGGPPTYSRQLRVIDVDGKGDTAVAGTTDGRGPAAYEPYWTMNSRNILFTLYPGALDYEGTAGEMAPARQMRMVKLEGANDTPFDGDWRQVAAAFISPDRKWRAQVPAGEDARGVLSFVSLPENPGAAKRGAPPPLVRMHWLDTRGGVMLSRPTFGRKPNQLVAQGRRPGLVVDRAGFARIDAARARQSSIWLLDRDPRRPVKLLVEDGFLRDWLQ